MGRSYSMDLRERAVRAVELEGLSRRAAAVRFGVAASPLITWVAHFRATGDLRPGQMGGHKPKKINWLRVFSSVGDSTSKGELWMGGWEQRSGQME